MPELIQPLEVMVSETSKTYCTKHRLGWAINGPMPSSTSKGAKHCHRVTLNSVDDLDKTLEHYFNRDFYDDDNDVAMSVNDKIWYEKVQNRSKRLGQKFCSSEARVKNTG